MKTTKFWAKLWLFCVAGLAGLSVVLLAYSAVKVAVEVERTSRLFDEVEQIISEIREENARSNESMTVIQNAQSGVDNMDIPLSGGEEPEEDAKIDAALEAQGYFSAAVPLSWEYQDYMRTYCRLYGCSYPLALAVAELESDFDMESVGQAGEVGIFQLHPGPDGAYHEALEASTGLDPATPEGNIAGGCWLLGKYLAEYEDVTMAAMAYNMGQARAEKAWKAGIVSTGYSEAVLEAVEQWECEVNAWAGE